MVIRNIAALASLQFLSSLVSLTTYLGGKILWTGLTAEITIDVDHVRPTSSFTCLVDHLLVWKEDWTNGELHWMTT